MRGGVVITNSHPTTCQYRMYLNGELGYRSDDGCNWGGTLPYNGIDSVYLYYEYKPAGTYPAYLTEE